VLASLWLGNLRIAMGGGPENVSGRLVTGNYFQTLGVQALLGRTFTADEDRNPGGDPVAVVSYGYWQRRFSGDAAVIGRTVRLNNHPFSIIGVAPPGFFGEVGGDRADLWPFAVTGLDTLSWPRVGCAPPSYTQKAKEDGMRRIIILGLVVCLAASTIAAWVHLRTNHLGGILPSVYAQSGCSLGTVTGSYGFAGSGLETQGPVPANITAFTPFTEVGLVTADGAGNVSGSIAVSFGGSSSTSTFSGTYTVAADCTGSAINTDVGGSVTHFNFVIVDAGKQVRFMQTDPGMVWAPTAIRQ
jgi:hypothetical protein